MDAAEVTAEPLPSDIVLHIINEWGHTPRAAVPGKTERPYPEPDWLIDLDPAAWTNLPRPTHEALVEVADSLFPIFRAQDGSECAEHLNELIGRAGLRQTFEAEGRAVRPVWHCPHGDNQLLAAAVLTVIAQLEHDPDSSRLGLCRGSECVDAYIDHSPAARRRYCGLTCQTRQRTRTYRAAKRQSQKTA
ncbi:CGNR zinc finger domain-containing protein [Enemella sp. A6]|uniref:CGNR zinc finger domain-containing protein n=1 Tax=Enemella sp. A6 TaxID=3440152 RepID=UPI003EB82B5D